MRIKVVITIAILLLTTLQQTLSAQARDAVATSVDLSELPLDRTLMLPEVPEKQKDYIKAYMKREAQALQKMGYKVETMRKGEVVIATIPAELLFAPNDTVLMAQADKQLKAFLPYFRTPDKFRVILAMHSDNTGSEDYLYKLTERRIVALYDYFDSKANNTESLQGYPRADSEPAAGMSNDTRSGRRANRRLEIYIVPGSVLIDDAKNKKL